MLLDGEKELKALARWLAKSLQREELLKLMIKYGVKHVKVRKWMENMIFQHVRGEHMEAELMSTVEPQTVKTKRWPDDVQEVMDKYIVEVSDDE